MGTGREVMSNLREGIQFYSGLADAVKKLSQMVSDLVMTRGINCQELDEDLTQKQVRVASPPTWLFPAFFVAIRTALVLADCRTVTHWWAYRFS